MPRSAPRRSRRVRPRALPAPPIFFACPARPAPVGTPGTRSWCTSSTIATAPAISSRSCRASTSTCAGPRPRGRRRSEWRIEPPYSLLATDYWQLTLHEGADTLDGGMRLRDDPCPQVPGMRHPRPDFELDPTSGGTHPIGHAHGIVEQDLVAADLDEGRRQTGRIAVERRCIGRARIGTIEI